MRKNAIIASKFHEALSLAATIQSNVVDIPFLDNVAIQGVYTGTPTGTFTVECSVNGTNWYDDTAAWTSKGTPAPAGSAGSFMFYGSNRPYNKIRINYARSAGTGSVDLSVTAKML